MPERVSWWVPGARLGHGVLERALVMEGGVVVSRTMPRAVAGAFRESRSEVARGRALELCCVCGSPAEVPGALQWDEESRESQGSDRGPPHAAFFGYWWNLGVSVNLGC